MNREKLYLNMKLAPRVELIISSFHVAIPSSNYVIHGTMVHHIDVIATCSLTKYTLLTDLSKNCEGLANERLLARKFLPLKS